MVEILNTNIEKVDKIFHLGDIHIRTYKRHKEYLKVFSKLKTYLKKNKTKNSIIYVAGDLVHSKTDMSPELISVLSKFLIMLCDIAPTIVILGNHDTNLNNSSRIDALQPIIDIIDHKNLYFLNKNGYYKFAQIGFNVMEVSTDPSDFFKPENLDAEIKIALYHGAVDTVLTDTNMKLSNDKVTIDTFKGHDLALLGDIHKRQCLLDKKPYIAYCGSLIQQNHAETLNKHGLLVWDLNTLSYEEVDIENEYGYYTLDVDSGVVLNWRDDIPKRPRFRVRYRNTSTEQKKQVESTIRIKRTVAEWTVQTISSYNVTSDANRISLGNIRSIDYQNNLIQKYLTPYDLDTDLLNHIKKINKETNSKLDEINVARNVVWKPIRFEFSNMFSYGENNFIDFSDMKGSYGIFAPNATGKSTLLDSLCFCLFDKSSKTNKSIDVLNKRKREFKCKLEFTINDKPYVIFKRGYRGYGKNNESIKVDIDFYTFDNNNNKISLNGDQRATTRKNIQSYVGTYEDFVLTALSAQNNGTNFIEKPQRERRDLLVQFMDIKVFEDLYNIASEDIKETKGELRALQKYDLPTKLSEAIKDNLFQYNNKNVIEKKIVSLNKKLDQYNKKHKKLLQSYKHFNEDEIKNIKNEISKLESNLIKTTTLLEKLPNIDKLKKSLEEYDLKISNLEDESVLEEKSKEYDLKLKKYHSYGSDIKIKKSEINQCQKLIKSLENHEYDKDCNYCIKHPIVQQGEEAKIKLKKYLEDLNKIEDNYSKISQEVKDLEYSKKYLFDLRTEIKHRLVCKQNLESTLEKNSFYEKTIFEINSKLEENNNKIETLLKKNKKNIEYNEQNAKLVDEVESNIKSINIEIENLNKQKIDNAVKISSNNQIIKDCEEKISIIKELDSKNKAYEYYLQSVRNSGIPYQLIEYILPEIQNEVNEILNQIVNFEILFESDSKNINTSIMYNGERAWPLESASGMEKFVSSLAIRTALIINTSLPKPNFITIDEGFGVLDADNLMSMMILFDVLKQNFDYLLCISHLDTMRDIVDKHIQISKLGGNSYINYE